MLIFSKYTTIMLLAALATVSTMLWFQSNRIESLVSDKEKIAQQYADAKRSVDSLTQSVKTQNQYVSDLEKNSQQRIRRYREDMIKVQEEAAVKGQRSLSIMSRTIDKTDNACLAADQLINEEIDNGN